MLERHDEQFLWANIKIVEEQAKKGRVKNITGYLLKAFDNAYSESATKYEKHLKEKEVENKQKLAALEKEKLEEESLKKEFIVWRNASINEKLETIEKTKFEEYKSEFIENLIGDSNKLFSTLYRKRGFEDSIIQVKRYNYLAEELLAKNENDMNKFRAIRMKAIDISTS